MTTIRFGARYHFTSPIEAHEAQKALWQQGGGQDVFVINYTDKQDKRETCYTVLTNEGLYPHADAFRIAVTEDESTNRDSLHHTFVRADDSFLNDAWFMKKAIQQRGADKSFGPVTIHRVP